MKKVLLGIFLLLAFTTSAKAHSLPYFGYWGWGTGVVVTYPNYFYGYSFYNPYPVYPVYPIYIPTYGALSYSTKTDTVGQAWGYPSRDAASESAMRGCNASDCAPVVWVQGGCAAIATSAEGRNLGWAYAPSKYEARNRAMRGCRQGGHTDCVPRAWVCSF